MTRTAKLEEDLLPSKDATDQQAVNVERLIFCNVILRPRKGSTGAEGDGESSNREPRGLTDDVRKVFKPGLAGG